MLTFLHIRLLQAADVPGVQQASKSFLDQGILGAVCLFLIAGVVWLVLDKKKTDAAREAVMMKQFQDQFNALNSIAQDFKETTKSVAKDFNDTMRENIATLAKTKDIIERVEKKLT